MYGDYDWQPISSAPVGVPVLISYGEGHKRVAVLHPDGRWRVSEIVIPEPPMWAPLPVIRS